jgi:cell division protein FtsB
MKQKLIDFLNTRYGLLSVVLVILILLSSYTIWRATTGVLGVNRLKEKLAIAESNLIQLKKQRDSAFAYIESQQSQILAKDNLIEFFKLKDDAQKNQLWSINKSLQNLNNKYEEASHFTDHYDADSILLYFSKFPRYHKAAQ